MTYPHATKIVIFYFKGTGVCFHVCGSADCQMNFVWVLKRCVAKVCNDNGLSGMRPYMWGRHKTQKVCLYGRASVE